MPENDQNLENENSKNKKDIKMAIEKSLQLRRLINKKLKENEGIDTTYTKGLKTQLKNLKESIDTQKELDKIEKQKNKQLLVLSRIEKETIKRAEKKQDEENEEDKLREKLKHREVFLTGKLLNIKSNFIKNKKEAFIRATGIDKVMAIKEFILGTKEQNERKQELKEEKKRNKAKAKIEKLVTKKKSLIEIKGVMKAPTDFVRKENVDLKEQKEQTRSLRDIAKSTKKMGKGGGIMGLLGGLGLLVGAGGLLGFLMTGKTEFLFSVIKGFTKGFKLLSKPILKVPKMFSKVFKGVFGKLFGSIFGKGLAKGAGKSAGKFAKLGLKFMKRLPGIGAILGLIFGIQRFRKGDIIGGLLELGSGIASMIPGAGTAISIAIDAYTLFRDFKRADLEGQVSEEIQEGPSIIRTIWEKITGIFGAIIGGAKMIIGKVQEFFGFLSGISIGDIVSKLISSLSFDNIRDKISNILKGAKDFMSPIIQWIGEKIKSAFELIKSPIKLIKIVGKKIFGKDDKEKPIKPIEAKEVLTATGEKTKEIESISIENLKDMKEFLLKQFIPEMASHLVATTSVKPAKKIRGLAEGGVVLRPRIVKVAEGKEPEAIVPLSKLDDVFRDLEASGIDPSTGAVSGIARAIEPTQIREMREGGDKGEERLGKLQEFLSGTLVPQLAKNIATELKNARGSSPEASSIADVY